MRNLASLEKMLVVGFRCDTGKMADEGVEFLRRRCRNRRECGMSDPLTVIGTPRHWKRTLAWSHFTISSAILFLGMFAHCPMVQAVAARRLTS